MVYYSMNRKTLCIVMSAAVLFAALIGVIHWQGSIPCCDKSYYGLVFSLDNTDKFGNYFSVPLSPEDPQVYAVVIDYQGESLNPVIPKKYKGHPVLAIANSAFEGRKITTVTITEPVRVIGMKAFKDCSEMTSLVIPESVMFIRPEAFSGCTSLSDLRLSNNVVSLELKVFEGCSSLKSIDIPDKLVSVSSEAFIGSGLESKIRFASIEDFEDKPSKLKRLYIDDTYLKVADFGFLECMEIETITISGGVRHIGSNAFEGCYNLKKVELQEGVAIIDSNAFFCCNNLREIIIPDSVQIISFDIGLSENQDVTIYCGENSYAHQWAVEHNIRTSHQLPKINNKGSGSSINACFS